MQDSGISIVVIENIVFYLSDVIIAAVIQQNVFEPVDFF
jgi:hypothetical protein